MIRTDKLIGKIHECGLNRTIVADKLGISRNTLRLKLEKGIFDSDEMEKLIDILHIEDPVSIFFASNVTYNATKRNAQK